VYTDHKQELMGKGDKKTTKGKRAMGSYGITRKRKEATVIPAAKPKKEKVAKATKEVKPKAAAKKPAAKKASTKTEK
jgi:ribosomal small subunit protein bTHX